jgi:hypothetical protein
MTSEVMKALLIACAAMVGTGTVGLAQMGGPADQDTDVGQQIEGGILDTGATDEAREAEREYLETYLGDLPDVSEIEPIEGAVNEPYRSCEQSPLMEQNLANPGGPGHRAQRDIDLYLSRMNVIASRDCTCATKIIPGDVVLAFEDRLKAEYQVAVLEPKHTRDLYKESREIGAVAEKLCGGDF